MPARGRRRTVRSAAPDTPAPAIGLGSWLAPFVGAVLIVGMSALASLAQATPEIFVAAALVFSLCEAIVLMFVGYAWSGRGLPAAVLTAALTAAIATPGRWEVAVVRSVQPLQAPDLVADLVLSVALGGLAGVAGATVLRRKLAALTQDAQQRFSSARRPPR